MSRFHSIVQDNVANLTRYQAEPHTDQQSFPGCLESQEWLKCCQNWFVLSIPSHFKYWLAVVSNERILTNPSVRKKNRGIFPLCEDVAVDGVLFGGFPLTLAHSSGTRAEIRQITK